MTNRGNGRISTRAAVLVLAVVLTVGGFFVARAAMAKSDARDDRVSSYCTALGGSDC